MVAAINVAHLICNFPTMNAPRALPCCLPFIMADWKCIPPYNLLMHASSEALIKEGKLLLIPI